MVTALAWSPDGKVLGVGRKDGKVEFWDVRGREKVREVNPTGKRVDLILWSPDGAVFVTASSTAREEGVLIFWYAASREALCSVSVKPIYLLNLDWSPDGRQIALGMVDWTVTLWDVVATSTRREEGE